MLCEAFILNWNEKDLIAKTIRHYKYFCEDITVFDNHSDDGSDKIAEAMGCTVKKFGIKGVLDDTEYLKIKNNCWKGSKAKWVIVVDADEIIYYPRMISLLMSTKEMIVKSKGFNMFAEKLPDNLFEVKRGTYDKSYSKLALFRPDLKDMNYVYGCHVANPKGHISYAKEKVFLLHYRNARGIDGVIERQKKYAERMSPKNKQLGLGCHYLFDEDKKRKDYETEFKASIDLTTVLALGLV